MELCFLKVGYQIYAVEGKGMEHKHLCLETSEELGEGMSKFQLTCFSRADCFFPNNAKGVLCVEGWWMLLGKIPLINPFWPTIGELSIHQGPRRLVDYLWSQKILGKFMFEGMVCQEPCLGFVFHLHQLA